MRRLTCEICGSTDLIKQDGVFVCQSCGCKYTIEEVKKMMIEGTVDVSGSTVKVDTSAKLQNLYTLARRAKEDNNIQDAAKYYHAIRLEDPNSWEAAFYGVYFTALDCTIGQIESAALSIRNTLDTVSDLIKKHVPKEEQKDAYTEFLSSAWFAGQCLFDAAENAYEKTYYVDIEDRIDASHVFFRRASECIKAGMWAGIAAEEIFDDYKLAETIYSSVVDLCESNLATQRIVGSCKKRLDGIKPKLRAIQEKRNEEYWVEHTEEKKQLEARIAEIESEIQQLTARLEPYDAQIAEIKKELDGPNSAESQLVELKKWQADLTTRKSQLGLFAGKQKKELQTQIDALQVEIDAADATAKRLKKELQDDVDVRIAAVEAERKPLLSRIGELEEELRRINFELTKDR